MHENATCWSVGSSKRKNKQFGKPPNRNETAVIDSASISHVCSLSFCLQLHPNVDGSRLNLGIKLWLKITNCIGTCGKCMKMMPNAFTNCCIGSNESLSEVSNEVSASSVNVDSRLRSIRQRSGNFHTSLSGAKTRQRMRIFVEGVSPQKTTQTKKNKQKMQTYSVTNLSS